MNTQKRKRLIILGSALGTLALLAGAVQSGFGAMYNTEDCMPPGWYATTPLLGPLQVGDTVVLCPPVDNPAIRFAIERHWITRQPREVCPGGLVPYVKQVYALPGARVDITPQAVLIDGKPVPHTASLPTTADGYTPMPHVRMGRFTVPAGQVLLLATHVVNAFDGRYFGPVPQSDVVRRAFRIG